MSLRRSALRGAPAIAGLAALTLITTWGQPAGNAASRPAPTKASTSVVSKVDRHPYSRAHLHSARLVRVSHPRASALRPGQHPVRQRVLPHLLPPGRDGVAGRRAAPPPGVRSTRLSARAASRLLASFDGVDAIQNSTAAGFDLEPPDEGLGAGHGFVANFVNVTGAIYDMHGSRVQAPFYLNPFFGETADAFTSDPRVYFDADTGRWFATILGAGFDAAGTSVTESHVDVATSDSPDPTGSWHVFRFDTSSPAHRGCPCLADYPILGVDGTNIYVSTQEFTSDLQSYNGAQLYVLPKSQLVAGASRVNVAAFENLAAGGSLAFRVQFANTQERAPAEFAMSTLDPSGSGDTRIAVWAVTHRGRVAQGRMPALSNRVISSEGYAPPPPVQTPPGFCDACGPDDPPAGEPTSGVVDSGPDAMYETQYANGLLVGAIATGVNVAGDVAPQAGIGWVVVTPRVRDSVVTRGTRVSRQGYLASSGLGLLYPHVNMTRNGSMVLAFGLGGPQTFLSAATSVARPDRGFGRVRVVEPGVTTDNGFTGTAEQGGVGRWGDYSNGQVIAGTNRVWLATQYIPNEGDGNANWGNRIWGLRLR